MVDFHKLRLRGAQRTQEDIESPIFRRRVRDITDPYELNSRMRGGLRVDDLSEDQRVVFDKVLAWYDENRGAHSDGLLRVGGYAGTGKSTLTAVIAKALDEKYSTQLHPLRIAFCAYTGKAANGLRQKLNAEGVQASLLGFPHFGGTLHSLFYQPLVDKRTGALVDWRRVEDLDSYDLIVVDEASMVDEEILNDILSYHRPVLAVGDHGQLPPVRGVGALMLNPDLRLERIHRQAADNPIIALATHVRETGDVPAKWDNTENVRFITYNQMFDVLEPLYETEDPADIAILTYTNKCRQRMNYQARCMRRKMDVPPEPIVGDQFVCLRNIKGTLFNGMRGVLEAEPRDHQDYWFNGKFFFPDDDLEVEGACVKAQVGREKTFSDFEELQDAVKRPIRQWGKAGMLMDYGYAMTVHKSQGSQFNHVFLIYERPGRIEADDFRRWLYTGATRAKTHLYVVVG